MPIGTAAAATTSYPPTSHESTHHQDVFQISHLTHADSKAPTPSIALSQRHVRSTEPLTAVDQDEEGQTPSLSSGTERKYLASLFWVMIVCGWNDASRFVSFAVFSASICPVLVSTADSPDLPRSGPLIPRMQEYFSVGYTIVSLIFVSICIGKSPTPSLYYFYKPRPANRND